MTDLAPTRARSAARALLELSLIAALTVSPVHAAWLPNGTLVVPWDGISPDLLGNGAGGGLLAWDHQGSIRTVRVGSDGSVPPGLPGGGTELSPSPYTQRAPLLIPDGTGGTYVIWADERWAQCPAHCTGTPLEIFALRLLADDSVAPGWPAGGLNVGAPPLSYFFPVGPQACSDGLGGFIVAWSEPAGVDGGNIRAKRFSPDGQSVWGSTPLDVCTHPALQSSPRLSPVVSGGAVIVWRDARDILGGPALYGSRINAAGTKLWGTQGISLGTGAEPTPPQLVADAAGGAYMLWDEVGLATTLGHIDATGGMDWATPLGDAATIGDAQISPDGAGGVLGAWSIELAGPASRDLHVVHLLADGSPPPSWTGPEVVCDATGAQRDARIATDGAGGAYVFWQDERAGGLELFATRLDASGGPAPSWPANGRLVCSAPGFRDVESLVPDGAGGAIALWMDQRDIPTEVLYAQRFVPGGILDAPTPKPAVASFALLGARENPTRGVIHARFRLPDAAPARLQLLDVAGRAIASGDVGALGAGTHAVDLGGAALAPGVYVLRLGRGGQAQAQRVVVVR